MSQNTSDFDLIYFVTMKVSNCLKFKQIIWYLFLIQNMNLFNVMDLDHYNALFRILHLLEFFISAVFDLRNWPLN